MRAMWQVNQRLAERVTNLETQFIDKLMETVENTTKIVAANTVVMERTAMAIDKLEAAVEASLRTQQGIIARVEASPCLMSTVLSEESKGRIAAAKRVASEDARSDSKGQS